MPWITLILFLISGFVAGKLFSLTNNRGRLKYLGLTIAAAIFTVMQLFLFIDFMTDSANFTAATEFIIEWGHITCLSFILSSLAIFIRESKPVFAQFPLFYTALPLLILISYLLVQDTYALKSWLIAIYQGGAIIVALLMYSIYTYRRSSYAMILWGVGIFFLSYALFWYVPAIQDSYGWIWKLLIGIGMIVTVLGYERSETKIASESL